MRLWSAACLTLFIALANTAKADDQPQQMAPLADRFFDNFVELYRSDPGALTHYPGGLSNISAKQMHRAVVGLDTTHFTYLYPMTIRGHELSSLQGTPIHRLSLMAVRGDQLIPIPFQIDEFDRTGLIWIKGANKAKPEGAPDIFDDFDELVFMFRDGGQETYQPSLHGRPDGRVLQEIRLDSPRNNPRYVYLVLDNPLRSEARYVHADLEKGTLDTTVLEMAYNPKNLIDIHRIASKVGPHHGVNIFDSVNVNISTGILNQNLRMSLEGGKNIRAVPIAVKDGPVRASMLVRTRIWYLYLPTFFNQHFTVHYYEQGIMVPSRFAIDGMRTLRFFLMFLREPRIELSFDFHNLNDAKVTFDSVFEKADDYGVVDGQMSEFENKMAATRLPGDWLHMNSSRSWEMFFANHMPVVEGGLFDSFLDGMTLSMVYRDDQEATLSHERFPGAAPRLGFTSSGLPHYVIDLLGAMPKLDFSNVETLGEAIIMLADKEGDSSSPLDKYDRAANKVLSKLRDQGRINSPTELAQAFIADMDRMRFTGLPRETFNSLLHDAIVATVVDPGEVRHGQVLAKMVALAKQRNVDLAALRYGSMDNTLWLPDWVGAGGPRDFYWQSQNPPSHVASEWRETKTESQ